MAIGAGIAAAGIGAGLLSSSSATRAARQTAAQAAAESGRQFDISMQQMQEAADYLQSIGVPAAEAQRIALESAELGPSAFEDIQIDPRLRQAQMGALGRLEEFGEAGLTDEEKAQQMMMMREASAGAQARDKAILQDMAQKGTGGSGAELIARLQGSQSAADRASVGQAQLAGQAQNRALQAMMQAGQLGGQIRGQEYGEQATLASARDRIAAFNEQQRVAAQQQMEIHNKALIQQQYESELAKRQAVAAAKTGTAQAGIQRAGQISKAGQASAAGEIEAGAAKSELYGTLGTAGATAYGDYLKSQKDTGADGGVMGYQLGGPIQVPNSNAGFDAGGVLSYNKSGHKFAGGGLSVPDSGMSEEDRYLEGDIVPGENFEGDRVDAKVNSGEMVINLEQQQRLMELLRGLRDLRGLGDEDIVSSPGEQLSPDVTAIDPSLGLPPEGALPPGTAGIPIGAPGELPFPPAPAPATPQFDRGGMVPAMEEGDEDTYSSYKARYKPRGVHSSMKYEREMEEKSNSESKYRKARIKAYETLINGGK